MGSHLAATLGLLALVTAPGCGRHAAAVASDAGEAGPSVHAVALDFQNATVREVLVVVSLEAEQPVTVDPDAEPITGCAHITLLSGKPLAGDELTRFVSDALASSALSLERTPYGAWIVRRSPGAPLPASCQPPPPPSARLDDPMALAPGNASATTKAVAAGIHRISPTEVEMTESARAAFLGDTSAQMQSVRLVSVEKDGGPAGFRVFAIRSGSVLNLIGIHNGDTLVSVNGKSIGTPAAALEASAQVRHAPLITLQIERDFTPMELVVHVVPDRSLDH